MLTYHNYIGFENPNELYEFSTNHNIQLPYFINAAEYFPMWYAYKKDINTYKLLSHKKGLWLSGKFNVETSLWSMFFPIHKMDIKFWNSMSDAGLTTYKVEQIG